MGIISIQKYYSRGAKMNITIVTDVLGAENNGTTVACMNFIRHLQSQNHNVKILCSDQDKKGLPNYYIVPNLNLGPFNALVKKNGVSLSKPKTSVVKEALKDADIVHIMLPFALGKKAMKIAKKNNLPTTCGCHMQAENFSSQLKMQDVKWFNNLVYKTVFKTYKQADAIHYPTQFMKDTLEKAVKKSTNGYIISNGVNKFIQKKDCPKPAEFKDKIVILSTGRYTNEKAQWVLIEAIKQSKYKDKIQLILAGQGPTESKLIEHAKGLPVPPIMKLFPREEMNEIINYADIYVHPAEMELEGIACIEAISCGKLTIVNDSDRSATKNFAIDEKCIFKMRNPKDLAEKIDYWIEHEDERKEYEDKYLNSSVAYDQEECMKRMEQMLYEVMNAHKQKTGKLA